MERQWFENLGAGNVKYFAPPKMTMETGATATATIIRPASGVASGNPSAGAPLKVANFMVVTLTAPDNPDAFKIESQDAACKFVPEDTPIQWTFKVTPLQPGAGMHLNFSSWVMYGSDNSTCSPDNPDRHPVLSETETVAVSAIPPPANLWTRLVVYIWSNPFKSLAWLLPGGVGFALVAKLVKWIRSKRKPANPPQQSPATQASPKP